MRGGACGREARMCSVTFRDTEYIPQVWVPGVSDVCLTRTRGRIREKMSLSSLGVSGPPRHIHRYLFVSAKQTIRLRSVCLCFVSVVVCSWISPTFFWPPIDHHHICTRTLLISRRHPHRLGRRTEQPPPALRRPARRPVGCKLLRNGRRSRRTLHHSVQKALSTSSRGARGMT
jgi:hypothetical protein